MPDTVHTLSHWSPKIAPMYGDLETESLGVKWLVQVTKLTFLLILFIVISKYLHSIYLPGILLALYLY